MPKILRRDKGSVLLKDKKGDLRRCSQELLGQASYMGEDWLQKCELESSQSVDAA